MRLQDNLRNRLEVTSVGQRPHSAAANVAIVLLVLGDDLIRREMRHGRFPGRGPQSFLSGGIAQNVPRRLRHSAGVADRIMSDDR